MTNWVTAAPSKHVQHRTRTDVTPPMTSTSGLVQATCLLLRAELAALTAADLHWHPADGPSLPTWVEALAS